VERRAARWNAQGAGDRRLVQGQTRRATTLSVVSCLPFPTAGESSLRALEAGDTPHVFGMDGVWVFYFDEGSPERQRTWTLWVFDDGIELWTPPCEAAEWGAAATRLVALAKTIVASTPFAAGLIVPAKRTAIGRRYKLGRVAARRPPLAPWSLVDAGTRDLLAPDQAACSGGHASCHTSTAVPDLRR
jgi:hypothetical protein